MSLAQSVEHIVHHKTLVGRLLDDGIAVPGAEKVTGSMCYLR